VVRFAANEFDGYTPDGGRRWITTANASGQVVIQFTRGGGPDNPKVCGITVTSR